MKNRLFLSLLIFCFVIIFGTTYVISFNITQVNQDLNSKTKDKAESTSVLKTEEQSLESKTIQTEETNLEPKTIDTQKTVLETKTMNENTTVSNQVSLNAGTPKEYNLANKVIETKYEFLRFSEDIPAYNVKIAEEEISRLPKKMIDTFYKEKWTICITNENISSKYFNGIYGNVMGLTITDNNKILIQNKKNSIQNAVVHEFGHYLDWYFDFPSLDAEFSEIYSEEANTFKSKITNSSCVSNEMEFFAHTFYYLIKDSSKCTPKALSFVQRYLSKL